MKGYFSKRRIQPKSPEGVVHPEAIGRQLRTSSLWIDASLFPANDDGEIWVPAGLILAKTLKPDDVDSDTTYGPTYKYVPYNSSASYGIGSDTAVGVLDELLNLNYELDQQVAPVIHSKLVEERCYVFGQEEGNIPDAVKTSLNGIFWV